MLSPGERLPKVGHLCTAPHYMQDVFGMGFTDVAAMKRLYIVGSELLHARQIKCFTLLGVCSIQTPLQSNHWG